MPATSHCQRWAAGYCRRATNAQVCDMVVEHEGCCVQPLGDHADFVWDGQSQRRYRCPQKHRARLDHRLTMPTNTREATTGSLTLQRCAVSTPPGPWSRCSRIQTCE